MCPPKKIEKQGSISDVPNSLRPLQFHIKMNYNPISVQCSLFLSERGFKFVLLEEFVCVSLMRLLYAYITLSPPKMSKIS